MSKMTWFKLHSDFRNDPKIKRLPIAERYAFIILLCLANESETRGIITGLDDDDIAFELEMQVEDWKTLKAKFRVKGFLDFTQEEILIRNWDKRQYDKPSDHPEATKQRKRLQREREKLVKEQEVTAMSRDVTPVSRGREDQIRSEEIRSEDLFFRAQEKKMNAPCKIEISLPEEKEETIALAEKPIDLIQSPPVAPPPPYSQATSDRIMQMRQAEKDKWTMPSIDCKKLSQDDDFVDFILKFYLPTVPDNRGKKLDIFQAETWIVKGQRDPARRDLVEIQIKAFAKYKESQQARSQQQPTPQLAPPKDNAVYTVPSFVKDFAKSRKAP